LGNAKINSILQDTVWIFPLLIFFPLKYLLYRFNYKVFIPWIISISLLNFLYSLIISLSPRNIGVILYKHYSNISADEVVMSHVENLEGFLENASTSFILSYITFFLCFLLIIFRKNSLFNIIFIFLLMLISIAPLVIDNLRGPLLSAFLMLFILVLILLFNTRMSLRIFVVFGSISLFFLIGILFLYSIAPDLLTNYIEIFGTSNSLIGDVRSQQQTLLINEFKSNWLFGRGIGAGLFNGFARSASGIDFELQYHMFLYKYGILFFATQFIPISWFIIQLIRIPKYLVSSRYTISSIVQTSILLAIIGDLIASYTNPYLKTGFLSGLIGVYLAMYSVNNNKTKKI